MFFLNMYSCVPWYTCENQWTALWIHFSPTRDQTLLTKHSQQRLKLTEPS